MDLKKYLKFFGVRVVSKSFFLIAMVLVIRTLLLPESWGFGGEQSPLVRYLEVPQIVWGLNNQKIAFARACLTARLLNRTLLMPSLSATLFYKEIHHLHPISFDKVFRFDRFNSLCKGFVQLGRYSDLQNRSNTLVVQKGSGRKWTVERDLDQLKELNDDEVETIQVVGKNPFLWHDHFPVKDYAKVFECLVLVDEISKEADKVVAKIKELGSSESKMNGYVAVHMRIEKDWMIHCKKREQRSNMSEICSSKDEIMSRVANIPGLKLPTVVYLAVADALVEDGSILNGWREGLVAVEKKKLGVLEIYKKHPYLIQAAIDYEVCSRADVFVGNSYSTFSSLLVLERSAKMARMGVVTACGIGMDVRWPSYAYNLKAMGESGPRPWMTTLTDSTLQAISYGSNNISC
ncbi:putative GDP-fucose protein O-fucosyltransferase [Helianthus annuus]|nr:putative GDP-fucose protein O-fucosyltransferase [Helianthus annuus]KAJ0577801.1 putative GDP-fucose protein O-fucosyltransferase [Helianthus annuus]KAJ0747729.1 putative GDP-fucose protein O-fucosyltransferase [Helianthus annuus]KAJ0923404.1 putative GDP-fucose protein O-fucosyltransferase [Helianthus annuus]